MSRLIHARSLRKKDLTAKWAVSAEFQLSKTGCFWSNIIVCYESSLVDGVKRVRSHRRGSAWEALYHKGHEGT